MAVRDGVFLTPIDVDRVFMMIARIESERSGVKITYQGKRLKETAAELKRKSVNA